QFLRHVDHHHFEHSKYSQKLGTLRTLSPCGGAFAPPRSWPASRRSRNLVRGSLLISFAARSGHFVDERWRQETSSCTSRLGTPPGPRRAILRRGLDDSVTAISRTLSGLRKHPK